MTDPIIPSPDLATSPEAHPHAVNAAFDSGDPEVIERVCKEAGILVMGPGGPLTGEARREANARLAGPGTSISVCPQQVHVADGRWRNVIDCPFGVAPPLA